MPRLDSAAASPATTVTQPTSFWRKAPRATPTSTRLSSWMAYPTQWYARKASLHTRGTHVEYLGISGVVPSCIITHRANRNAVASESPRSHRCKRCDAAVASLLDLRRHRSSTCAYTEGWRVDLASHTSVLKRYFCRFSPRVKFTCMCTAFYCPARPLQVQELWIYGLYDPETSNGSPAVSGLGSTGISVVNSQVRAERPRSQLGPYPGIPWAISSRRCPGVSLLLKA